MFTIQRAIPPLLRTLCLLLSLAAGTLLPATAIAANDKVVLQLKWKHQFQFAGFYAAQMQGFYAEEGLEVAFNEIIKGRSATDVVLSGEAQYGISDSSLVLGRLRGQPLVVLAAVFQHSPLVLLTLRSSDIINPLELKGKKVMYQKNIDDAVLLAMFTELGLKDEDHTHIPQNFDYRSLLDGRADAISAYTTNQPYHFQQLGIAINTLSPANYGIDFYGDMIFVEESYLKANKDQALAFRRASLKGWQYALDHPEEVIDWMLANLDTVKTRDHLLYEAERTARLIQPELVELGYFSPNRFYRIADIYKKQKLAPYENELQGIDYREYYGGNAQSKRWLSIIGLVLLAFMVLAFILWSINLRLKAQVNARTKELRRANLSLGNYLSLINRYVMTSTIDRAGIIEQVSDAFCQTTGYTTDELIGTSHTQFHHPDADQEIYRQIIDQVRGEHAWSGEVLYRGKQGQDIWLECDLAPQLKNDGSVIGYTSVFVDITVKKQIETISLTDTLTGLSNRRQLDDTITRTMATSKRHDRPFSVLLLDLDNFKRVNDSYGHLIGDEILKDTGQILKDHTRQGDTPGRWGGEEFLIICPETNAAGAQTLAELLRKVIYHHEFSSVPSQTCSFGVAQWKPEESFDDLLERADRALYKAKEQGRNCVVLDDSTVARLAHKLP